MAMKLTSPILRGVGRPSTVITLAPALECPLTSYLWEGATLKVATEASTRELLSGSYVHPEKHLVPDIIIGEPTTNFASLGDGLAPLRAAGAETWGQEDLSRFGQVYSKDILQDVLGRAFLVASEAATKRINEGKEPHKPILNIVGPFDHMHVESWALRMLLRCAHEIEKHSSSSSKWTFKEIPFEQVNLLSGRRVSILIPKGEFEIEVDSRVEGPECSICFFGKNVGLMKTSGLEHELPSGSVDYGDLTRLHNYMKGDSVTIRTSKPVVWNHRLHLERSPEYAHLTTGAGSGILADVNAVHTAHDVHNMNEVVMMGGCGCLMVLLVAGQGWAPQQC